MQKNLTTKRLSFGAYFWTVTILALIGLAGSIYLSISHYRVYTDMAYSSFCAVSRSINCDTVSQSPYSIFLDIPVPIWGVLGYLFFLLGLPLAASVSAARQRMWSLLSLVAVGYSLYGIILAAISTFFIHSYCIVCILTYAVNFMLLFYCGMIRRRFNSETILAGIARDLTFIRSRVKYMKTVFIPFGILVAGVVVFIPTYWLFIPPRLSADIPKGTTLDGHPWIGAENPKLIITEFTDYQCFQCNKMHFYLRHLTEKYPAKIRLVHRHFPMDHIFNPIVKTPLHVRAGGLALLAIYAAGKGKFWEMNDLLFDIARQTQGIDLEFVARKIGLAHAELLEALKDRSAARKLIVEIREALKLGVAGTPVFLIEGKLYFGQIPPQIIKKALL